MKMKSKRQYGFSLMEVLVALLILSVGLLGLAGMQIAGLRSVSNSSSYTQAVLALNDMAERIRANPTAVKDNAFLSISSAADVDCTVMPAPYCSSYYDTGTSSGITGVSCSPAELVTYDLNVWFCGEATIADGSARTGALSGSLPGASFTISCTDIDTTDADACTAGSTHDIVISWNERNADNRTNAGAAIARNIRMTIQP